MEVNKIICYDIETLAGMFLYMDYDPSKDKWSYYGVWKGHNSLDAMYKHYEELRHKKYYQVGFNSLSFDSQAMEYVMRSIPEWHQKTNEEILALIYRKSQNIINDNNHGLFPPYRESELFIKQIDLFKIAHYDNENKRTSLKWLEYMMDMPSIEDIPVAHDKEQLNDEEIKQVISYCRNDIKSTYQFYKYMRGRVNHDFYKGQDKIQDRIDLINELKVPDLFLNYSDVRIGDELNKLTYSKITGKSPQQIYELKKGRRLTKRFTFGDAIPGYVQFKTQPFVDFYNSIRKERVKLNGEDQEYKFTFNGTTYTIARGGIHSNESYRAVIPKENELLKDADVGGQHPNAIWKRKLYPSHLGPKWNEVCVLNLERKEYYKQSGKDTKDDLLKRRFKGLETMTKYSLNGGLFGKTLERTNWQYGPEVGFYCTIGNQFEVLMLIEELEINNIHCISANTDGIVCLFDKSLDEKYYEICNEWEKTVGNDVKGKLEYQEFVKLVQESVNCYYAVKPDGEVKRKGRLNWEDEIHKNNSKDLSRIERKALFNFFTKDIPVEDTIRTEENIYMFCIGVKASKNYRFETTINGTTSHYTRVLRYFVSKEGSRLLKVKNDNVDTNGAQITRVAGDNMITVLNRVEDDHRPYFNNINYDYYIQGASEARDMILRGGKKTKLVPKEQLSLFN